MYSGEISSPKELQAMQADVEQLRRHQRTIENRELELMEVREPLDATLGDLEQQRAALGDRDRRVTRPRSAAAEAEIIAEMRPSAAARDELAGEHRRRLCEREYERCRAQAKGRRRGAPRRHHVPGLSPVDPGHRGGADQALGWPADRALRQLRRDPGSLMLDEVVVYFDGGARGNPGPAAIGAVVLDPSTHAADAPRRGERAHRRDHQQRRRVPGAHRRARGRRRDAGTRGAGARRLEARDRAARGAVEGEAGAPPAACARGRRSCSKDYEDVDLAHVRREQNTDADALVNAALDLP